MFELNKEEQRKIKKARKRKEKKRKREKREKKREKRLKDSSVKYGLDRQRKKLQKAL